jgi:hypothetical protein
MAMELPEPAERMQRPELDPQRPAKLFSYAAKKQQWIRERMSEHQIPDAIDYLAEELEAYATNVFMGGAPELAITSRDVYYTREINGQGSARLIEMSPLPLNGDAELYGEHTIQGRLYGFHRGEGNDIRTYVEIGDGVRQFMGGVYTPLLSVGVEGSEIRLAEYSTIEKLEELGEYINEQLKHYTSGSKMLVAELLRGLNEKKEVAVKRLHDSSPVIAGIARQEEVTPQFIEALMEIIKLKLKLDTPHDIQTTLYREVITEWPTASYKAQKGPVTFNDIVPQLDLIGESANKGLGLFFLNNDKAVQIPVQYITSIYKTQ